MAAAGTGDGVVAETGQQPGAPANRSAGVRLSELVAALSFSSDLALGQPMEHVLRSCLIALRLADRLGLDQQQRTETYWVTLLALVCTGESFELAQLFGDDVAFRSGMYHVGPSQLGQMIYVLGQAGSDRSATARMRTAAGIALTGGKTVEARFLAHCAVTRQVSRRFGLPPGWGRRCRTPSPAGTERASPAGSRRRTCPCRCD